MYKNVQKFTLRTASLLSIFFCFFYNLSAFASTRSRIDSLYSSGNSSSIRAANEEDCHRDSSSHYSSNLLPAVVFGSFTFDPLSIDIDAINLNAVQIPHKLYLIVKSGNSPPLA
jgi:hypothetical protein